MAGVDDIIGGWVRDAEKSGEVKKLPGYGKPLNLEEDRHVPQKYRMAFRILRSSGYAPPEVEMIQRVAELRADIEAEPVGSTRTALRAELAELQRNLDIALDKYRSGS